MTLFYELFSLLTVTVVCLCAVIVAGLRARRRAHITLVVIFFISLGFTVFAAERLGGHLDLDAAGRITDVHLALAKITTLGYLLPVTTGILTLRRPHWRVRHRWAVILMIVLTLTTLVTGTWMGMAAEPL